MIASTMVIVIIVEKKIIVSMSWVKSKTGSGKHNMVITYS